ncbi:hypothetical protein K2X33_00550, partial [bacterium]|nr:hypothetical protein [bacterium]
MSTSLFVVTRSTSSVNRVVARLVDCLVAASIFSLGYRFSYSLAVVFTCTYLLFQDGWGQSIGKRLLGLRLCQEGTLAPATLAQGVLRNVP